MVAAQGPYSGFACYDMCVPFLGYRITVVTEIPLTALSPHPLQRVWLGWKWAGIQICPWSKRSLQSQCHHPSFQFFLAPLGRVRTLCLTVLQSANALMYIFWPWKAINMPFFPPFLRFRIKKEWHQNGAGHIIFHITFWFILKRSQIGSYICSDYPASHRCWGKRWNHFLVLQSMPCC